MYPAGAKLDFHAFMGPEGQRQIRLSYISTRHFQATYRQSETGDELYVWRTPALSVSSPPQPPL